MNDNPGLCISIFIVSVILAAFLTMICLEIGKMSGGKLKFLEEANKKLSDKLDEVFPLREEWIFAGRIAVIICSIAAVVSLSLWWDAIHTAAPAGQHIYSALWIPVTTIVVVYCLMEIASSLMSTTASAKLLLFSIPLLKATSCIFFPITFPLAALSRFVTRKRISKINDDEGPSVEDEILSLVEGESQPENTSTIPDLQEDEKRMIVGALELDEINVRRIMTPRVDVTGVEYFPDMKLEDFVSEARNAIIESGHSRIPVYTDTIDNVIGIIYSKDLLDKNKVADFSSLVHPHPLFIPVSKNIGDLLEEFRQSKIHLAIVVDEYGGTAGIVTFEDVLETLVGDIKDEYDFAEGNMELKELKPGLFLCNGRTPINLVNKVMDIDIPDDEEYDTIGGYISTEIGRIPTQGETIKTPAVNAFIKTADNRRAIELELSKPDNNANSSVSD